MLHSASEFDNGIMAFGLMKVTISRRQLNASLISKILLTRFASSDGLAIEMIFDDAQPDSCELRHLAHTANREAQLDSCELRHWHALPKGKCSLTHVGWVHDLK